MGLMTIGSIEASTASTAGANSDFERLVESKGLLATALTRQGIASDRWGIDGNLQLSMGMSADFEKAVASGSDIVRVGTTIFGSRKVKE